MPETLKDLIANKYGLDALLRIKDLASIPARTAKMHRYKSGASAGKARLLGARKESKGIIGVSERTIWDWVRAGKFPAPIKLSPTITAWRAKDIAEWLQSKEMENKQ